MVSNYYYMNSLLSATIFMCTLSIDNYFFYPFEAVCFNPFQVKTHCLTMKTQMLDVCHLTKHLFLA
uniref:Uncharacterized protein n=1 Tax=Aegilops tauschii subsp. strangulata TaxID=200361 RepID=A0A453C012_AEGTS